MFGVFKEQQGDHQLVPHRITWKRIGNNRWVREVVRDQIKQSLVNPA